jgi:hypothetical protein
MLEFKDSFEVVQHHVKFVIMIIKGPEGKIGM